MAVTQKTNADDSGELDLNVSQEFIEESKKTPIIIHPPKKGGPYTKDERIKIENEIYRLHFDYGYSARKIAKLMKINRNTVNYNLNLWYARILSQDNTLEPENKIVITLQRLEVQRTRLRERLDKTSTFQEKISVERMMYEIDSKIMNMHLRTGESLKRVLDLATNRANKWLAENKENGRYISLYDKISVSTEAREKIDKIIKEDRRGSRYLD